LPAAAQAGGGDWADPKRPAHRDSAPEGASRNGSPRRSAGTSLLAIADTQRDTKRIESPPLRAGSGTGKLRANSDHAQQPDPTIDADGRRWPTLLPAPPDLKKQLEGKIKELSEELTQRYAQIADLCNERQQQESELQEARNIIDSVDKSIAILQDAIAKHESEASTARQALALANKENETLRMQMERMKCDSTAMMKRSLKVEVDFNDREVEIASTRETIEFLRRDVAAKSAEASNLRTAIKDANRRHRDELNQKDVQIKIQFKKFEVMLAERDMQLKALDKAHSKLIERYNSLSNNMDSIESTDRIAEEKTKSQSELVELLETLLKAEREAAAIKIKELTAELQRERAARTAVNNGPTAAQKDVVRLSSNPAARRLRVYEHAFDSSMSHNNAA
jgi:hypothetical protein